MGLGEFHSSVLGNSLRCLGLFGVLDCSHVVDQALLVLPLWCLVGDGRYSYGPNIMLIILRMVHFMCLSAPGNLLGVLEAAFGNPK